MKQQELTLSDRIAQASNHFTASQKTVARYFLSNKPSAILKTAATIAAEIGVSESTIVRFARAIGFESYTQMQKASQQQYLSEFSFSNRLEQQNIIAQGHEFYETLMRNEANAILQMIRPDFMICLDQATDLIINAEKTYVIGSRGSASVATHIAYNLRYIKSGIIPLVSDSGDWQDQMIDCSFGDLVIGICMPYYTQRTVDMLQFGKKQGASILTITDSTLSPSYPLSDTAICCGHSFMWSPSAAITVANVLLQKVSQSGKPEILERLQKMEKILNLKSPYTR